MRLTPEQQQILSHVREKAAKLVEDLEAKALELEQNPSRLDLEQAKEGRLALRNAVAAARRALENIEKAAQIGDNR
jgi:hypothetical protein